MYKFCRPIMTSYKLCRPITTRTKTCRPITTLSKTCRPITTCTKTCRPITTGTKTCRPITTCYENLSTDNDMPDLSTCRDVGSCRPLALVSVHLRSHPHHARSVITTRTQTCRHDTDMYENLSTDNDMLRKPVDR